MPLRMSYKQVAARAEHFEEKQQARSKYGNVKTKIDGYTFDSLAEARRYGELKLLVMAGEIQALEVHPRYELQPAFTTANGKKVQPIAYEADFAYIEHGQRVVEDVKGGEATQTQVFKLKAKLLKYRYRDIELRIIEV